MQTFTKIKSPTSSKKSAPKGVPGKSTTSGGVKPLCILFRPKIEPSRGQKTPKCFLNVDEYFYHKTTSSQGYKRKPHYKSYTCYSCGKNLRNNLRFMSHTRHKVLNVWENKDREENKNTCVYCYRKFDTPFERQCHVELVHSTSNSQTTCKICDVYFESEQLFLQHMKTLHCRKEMPYVCYVCNFRSSFYNDVIQHFKHAHGGTSFLQCCFCLQVRNAQNNFLTHTIAHVKNTVQCHKCRLQFITQEELTNHEEEHETNMANTDLMSHEVYVHINYEKVPEQKAADVKRKQPSDNKKVVTSPVKSKTNAYKWRSNKNSSSGAEVPLKEEPHYTAKPKEAKLPSYLQPVVIPRSLSKVGITDTGYDGLYNCWECKNVIGYSGKHFRYHFGAVYECKCCAYMTACKYACDNHIILKHVEPGLSIDFESPAEDEEFTGFAEDEIFDHTSKQARTVASEKALKRLSASIKVEPGVHNEIFAASFEKKRESQEQDNEEPMDEVFGDAQSNNMKNYADSEHGDTQVNSQVQGNNVNELEKTHSKDNLPTGNDMEPEKSEYLDSKQGQIEEENVVTGEVLDDMCITEPFIVQDIAASMDVSTEQPVESEDSERLQMEKSTMEELEALVFNDAEISRLCATKPVKAPTKDKTNKQKEPVKILPKKLQKKLAHNCFPNELDEKGWEKFFKRNPQLASSTDYPYKFTFTKTGLKPLPKDLETATEQYKEELNLGAKELVLTPNAVKASGDQLMSKLPAKYLLINDPKDNKILLTPVGNNKDLMQMPRPPTHLRFSLITATSVVVQWSHPQYCTFTQYKIVFKGVKSPTSKILPPNQTIVRLIDLVPDTTYDVKVYSLCKNIQSYFVQGGFQTLKKDEIVIKTQTMSFTTPTPLSSNTSSSSLKLPIMLQSNVAHLNSGMPISLPISIISKTSSTFTGTIWANSGAPVQQKSTAPIQPNSALPTKPNLAPPTQPNLAPSIQLNSASPVQKTPSEASLIKNNPIANPTKVQMQGAEISLQGPKMLAPVSSNSNLFTLVPSQQTLAKLKKKATARKTIPAILRRNNQPQPKKTEVITLSSDEEEAINQQSGDAVADESEMQKFPAGSTVEQQDDAGQVNIVSSTAEKDGSNVDDKNTAEAVVSTSTKEEGGMKTKSAELTENDCLKENAIRSTTISMDLGCLLKAETQSREGLTNPTIQNTTQEISNDKMESTNTSSDKNKVIPTLNTILSTPVKNINSFESIEPPTLDDLKTAMCEDVF